MEQMKRKKVLVVDDDETIRTLLKDRLTANFYDVVTASDGREGLDKYRDEQPDLIISDVDMPNMDGYSFVIEFKQIGSLKETPVIMLTAKEQMREIFRIEGINDYIVKPFRMSGLLTKITKHLDAHHKKVLIVDDEADFADLLKRRLELSGYNVQTSCNGHEGLQKVKDDEPDLVLLDIMMPKMDGYNFCRMLKFDERYKNIMIIFVTAKSQDADRFLGMEVGADAYLTKPFEAEDLLQKMKELLWD